MNIHINETTGLVEAEYVGHEEVQAVHTDQLIHLIHVLRHTTENTAIYLRTPLRKLIQSLAISGLKTIKQVSESQKLAKDGERVQRYKELEILRDDVLDKNNQIAQLKLELDARNAQLKTKKRKKGK